MNRENFRTIIHDNCYYFYPYLILWVMGLVWTFIIGKPSVHLYLNQFHHPLADDFFRWATKLGEAYVFVGVIVITLFIKFRHTLFFLASFLSSFILVQFLKKVVFSSIERPTKYFEHDTTLLYLVDGVTFHHFQSFPSGHTAAGFSICTALALWLPKKMKSYSTFILILAFLIGYSRVYLSQHFMIDVLTGSVIAVTFSLIWYPNFYGEPLRNHSWMDHSIPLRK